MLHNLPKKLYISNILVSDNVCTLHALLRKHCANFVHRISYTANSFLSEVLTFGVFVRSVCNDHFTRPHGPTISVLVLNLYNK